MDRYFRRKCVKKPIAWQLASLNWVLVKTKRDAKIRNNHMCQHSRYHLLSVLLVADGLPEKLIDRTWGCASYNVFCAGIGYIKLTKASSLLVRKPYGNDNSMGTDDSIMSINSVIAESSVAVTNDIFRVLTNLWFLTCNLVVFNIFFELVSFLH